MNVAQKGRPLVSVVMPAFHSENFIAHSLQSVLSQSLSDWEVLVVEDGSKDKTESICAEYNRKSGGRVRYFSQPTNKGPAASRNMAIRMAEGQYLAFLDSDDLWSDNHLESLIRTLGESGSKAAFSDYANFRSEEEFQRIGVVSSALGRQIAPTQLFENCILFTPSIMVERELVLSVGLFDESMRLGEDLDLWIRIIRAGHKFEDSRVRTFWRRIRAGSVSTNSVAVAEFTGKLYLKHMDWTQLDRAFSSRRAAINFASAARMYFWRHPELAAPLYYQAWKLSEISVYRFSHYLAARCLAFVYSVAHLSRGG